MYSGSGGSVAWHKDLAAEEYNGMLGSDAGRQPLLPRLLLLDRQRLADGVRQGQQWVWAGAPDAGAVGQVLVPVGLVIPSPPPSDLLSISMATAAVALPGDC